MNIYSSPAIGPDGTIYFGSNNTIFYALNGKTGDKLWGFQTDGALSSSPAIGSDGTVSVAGCIPIDNIGRLYAINTKTGTKLWEFEFKTSGQSRSSPVIATDGTVYIGSDYKKLFAIKTDSKGPAQSAWPMGGQNAQRTGRVK